MSILQHLFIHKIKFRNFFPGASGYFYMRTVETIIATNSPRQQFAKKSTKIT